MFLPLLGLLPRFRFQNPFPPAPKSGDRDRSRLLTLALLPFLPRGEGDRVPFEVPGTSGKDSVDSMSVKSRLPHRALKPEKEPAPPRRRPEPEVWRVALGRGSVVGTVGNVGTVTTVGSEGSVGRAGFGIPVMLGTGIVMSRSSLRLL